jgi:predicted RNase H-like nuclease
VATVAGVDGCRRGWVAVVLRDGAFASAETFVDFVSVLTAARAVGCVAVGVDMPIGLLDEGTRECERVARARLKRASGTVFPMPPRSVLEAPSHADALARCRELGVPGVSAQGFALRTKIMQVERAVADAVQPLPFPVLEVHPELAFLAMNGDAPLESKKTWNGFWTRARLLREHGIDVPERLDGVGGAIPDDVLDAAAVAWSADRYARGEAVPLPAEPQTGPSGERIAIWY